MRILVDQDDVLAKFLERVIEYWNEDTKQNVSIEDIKNWDFKPLDFHYVRGYCRYPDLYRDLDPVEGALEGMRKLHDAGHELFVVSGVPAFAGIAYHGKLAWLRQHMPWFPLKNFIACQRKDLVIGDLLLDDGAHNITAFDKAGRKAVIFDRPHNRSYSGSSPRVHSWKDFMDLFEKGGI